jgi:hypothetical protein
MALGIVHAAQIDKILGGIAVETEDRANAAHSAAGVGRSRA